MPVALRLALGDIVLGVGKLEELAYDIAAMLRLHDPAKDSTMRALGLIQARAGDRGLPPWALPGVTKRNVIRWSKGASQAIDQRNVIFHATTAFQVTEAAEWAIVRHSLKDGQEVVTRVDELNAFVERVDLLWREGMFIHLALSIPVEGGRAFPPYVKHRIHKQAHLTAVGPFPEEWQEWIDGEPGAR